MEPSFCPATQAVCRWHEHVLPMDLESRYARLEEKINHMLAGHQYLLSEIRQLREPVKVLARAIEGTKLQPAMDAIAAVQVMMGSLVQTWGPLQQALTEVAGAVRKLSVMTGQIQENVARAKIVGK